MPHYRLAPSSGHPSLPPLPAPTSRPHPRSLSSAPLAVPTPTTASPPPRPFPKPAPRVRDPYEASPRASKSIPHPTSSFHIDPLESFLTAYRVAPRDSGPSTPSPLPRLSFHVSRPQVLPIFRGPVPLPVPFPGPSPGGAAHAPPRYATLTALESPAPTGQSHPLRGCPLGTAPGPQRSRRRRSRQGSSRSATQRAVGAAIEMKHGQSGLVDGASRRREATRSTAPDPASLALLWS